MAEPIFGPDFNSYFSSTIPGLDKNTNNDNTSNLDYVQLVSDLFDVKNDNKADDEIKRFHNFSVYSSSSSNQCQRIKNRKHSNTQTDNSHSPPSKKKSFITSLGLFTLKKNGHATGIKKILPNYVYKCSIFNYKLNKSRVKSTNRSKKSHVADDSPSGISADTNSLYDNFSKYSFPIELNSYHTSSRFDVNLPHTDIPCLDSSKSQSKSLFNPQINIYPNNARSTHNQKQNSDKACKPTDPLVDCHNPPVSKDISSVNISADSNNQYESITSPHLNPESPKGGVPPVNSHLENLNSIITSPVKRNHSQTDTISDRVRQKTNSATNSKPRVEPPNSNKNITTAPFLRSISSLSNRKHGIDKIVKKNSKATLALSWASKGLSAIPLESINGVRSTLITRVCLSKNGLSTVPSKFFELTPNLEHLDLSENFLTCLKIGPNAVIGKLKSIDLSKNLLTSFLIPDKMFPDLRYIDLSDNQIVKVPNNIFIPERANTLVYVDLSNNRIKTLPPALAIMVFSPTPKILKIGLNPLKMNSGMALFKEASKRAGKSFVENLVLHYPSLRNSYSANQHIINSSKGVKTKYKDIELMMMCSPCSENEELSSSCNANLVSDQNQYPDSSKKSEMLDPNIIVVPESIKEYNSSSPSIYLKSFHINKSPLSHSSPGATRTCSHFFAPPLEYSYNIKGDPNNIVHIYSYILTWWIASLSVDIYLLSDKSLSATGTSDCNNCTTNALALLKKAWDFCIPVVNDCPCTNQSHEDVTVLEEEMTTKSGESECPKLQESENNSTEPCTNENLNILDTSDPQVVVKEVSSVADNSQETKTKQNVGAPASPHAKIPNMYSKADMMSTSSISEFTARTAQSYYSAKEESVHTEISINSSKSSENCTEIPGENMDTVHMNNNENCANPCIKTDVEFNDSLHMETDGHILSSCSAQVSLDEPSMGRNNTEKSVVIFTSANKSRKSPHKLPWVEIEYSKKTSVCHTSCSMACHQCSNYRKLKTKLESVCYQTSLLSEKYCNLIDSTMNFVKAELDYLSKIGRFTSFLRSKMQASTFILPIYNLLQYLINDVVKYHTEHLLPALPNTTGYGPMTSLCDSFLEKFLHEIIPGIRRIYSIYSTNYRVVMNLINTLDECNWNLSEGSDLSPCSLSPYCDILSNRSAKISNNMFTWKGILYTYERTVVPVHINLDSVGIVEWKFWSKENSLRISGGKHEILTSMIKMPLEHLSQYHSSLMPIKEALEYIPGSSVHVKEVEGCLEALNVCVANCQDSELFSLVSLHSWQILSGFVYKYKPYDFMSQNLDEICTHAFSIDKMLSLLSSAEYEANSICVEEALCPLAIFSDLEIINLSEAASADDGGDCSSETKEKVYENTGKSSNNSNPANIARVDTNNKEISDLSNRMETSKKERYTYVDDNLFRLQKGYIGFERYPVSQLIYPLVRIAPSKVLFASDSINNSQKANYHVAINIGTQKMSIEDARKFNKLNVETSNKIPNLFKIGGVLKSLAPFSSKSRIGENAGKNDIEGDESYSYENVHNFIVTINRIVWVCTRLSTTNSCDSGTKEETCRRVWVHSFNLSNTRITRVPMSPIDTEEQSKIVRIWDGEISLHLWDFSDEAYSFLASILPRNKNRCVSSPVRLEKKYVSPRVVTP